jgi:hypothetical protein
MSMRNLNWETQVMAAVRDNKAQSRFELDVEGGSPSPIIA